MAGERLMKLTVESEVVDLAAVSYTHLTLPTIQPV